MKKRTGNCYCHLTCCDSVFLEVRQEGVEIKDVPVRHISDIY